MATINFNLPDGTKKPVDATPGTTLMAAASNQGVHGLIAECGGGGMCATCHIYVDESWVSKLPPLSEIEDEMLNCTFEDRKPNSRLSCQVEISEELDGMKVTIPNRQR